ncbi:hypothetical protein QK292_10920 [Arthrobacter sp. AL08]|uniref:hypothetical protein n=1 Tax=Micrococcaceae TaxID=1268 RepID=UPI001D000ECF|nr:MULTISPECIES: hypothetical protein [Micrococcaceae]MDI3241978.1 hypothetical protein [Arthrobacter sp. AL05]MDI3278082.1 hypothetical protein [Arthrobacter sp. AL08]MDJ0354171.1 hypothetical protein [Pseudarthrobacter sp. PH31-O2]WGZ79312.1 hypothetical protein QI450_15930 [Arthrobacter sp. EM1]
MDSGTAGISVGAGGTSSGALLAAEAEACASRSYEVQQLAARLAGCADRADAALADLVRLELQSWQSPAGRAYRTALSVQAASLRHGRIALHDAVAAVLRHAGSVAVAQGRPGY